MTSTNANLFKFDKTKCHGKVIGRFVADNGKEFPYTYANKRDVYLKYLAYTRHRSMD